MSVRNYSNFPYFIGDFSGKEFTPETEIIKFSHARNFYASQTFNGIPKADGRRVQIGWARYTDTPGMPFNQMMNRSGPLILDSGLSVSPCVY